MGVIAKVKSIREKMNNNMKISEIEELRTELAGRLTWYFEELYIYTNIKSSPLISITKPNLN